jgi:hypothetical protein
MRSFTMCQCHKYTQLHIENQESALPDRADMAT